MKKSFFSIYSHGFIRVSVCVPRVKVADPVFNTDETIKLYKKASENHSALALFPELGISAYSNDDLFHQKLLLEKSEKSIAKILCESEKLFPVILVGAPVMFQAKLFNCAIVIHNGKILGIIPKTYLPNYREFYEKRQFVSGENAIAKKISFAGQPDIPFGTDLVFQDKNLKDFSVFAEICEDVWTPIPPSSYGALAGANILANLSASNITVGKADYRRSLCKTQSGRCISAYLYSAAGPGESTTDLSWDGYALIYENGRLLSESQRFSDKSQIITADIDVELLSQERLRSTSFNDAGGILRQKLENFRFIPFEFRVPRCEISLMREVERFPFVPSDDKKRDELCYEAYNIQVHGLIKRLSASGIKKIVIGVSGGLDSTQALIVAAKTMDRLGFSRKNILAYTMPGFATSMKTRQNAIKLMSALGVTSDEIDIKPSCMQMLKDIGHPYPDGKAVYDITFENVQAGERTSHLFRLANLNRAIVLGTGDLSELALGWATYGVGDHMSHYNVNASVPKTLIQHLISWVIATKEFDPDTCEILTSILNTEISPELVPANGKKSDEPAQSTQAKIGPYELQDFNLYYITRFGFSPKKVAFLAYHAWKDKKKGRWSDLIPYEKRNEYSLSEIKKWLEVFVYRFFKISQFKRTAVPNGPKVGSGGSLSPRGDWRAPSDSEAKIWLDEVKHKIFS